MDDPFRDLKDAVNAFADNPESKQKYDAMKRIVDAIGRTQTFKDDGAKTDGVPLLIPDPFLRNITEELRTLTGINFKEYNNVAEVAKMQGKVYVVINGAYRMDTPSDQRQAVVDLLTTKNSNDVAIIAIHLSKTLPGNISRSFNNVDVINLLSKPVFGGGVKPALLNHPDVKAYNLRAMQQLTGLQVAKSQCSICNETARWMCEDCGAVLCGEECYHNH